MNSLAEFHTETMAIARRASDIVNEPIVRDGYVMSGRPAAMAYVNLASMAGGRLKRWFPFASMHDEAFLRIYAEARLIVAECLKRKYEARRDRKKYDHLADATEKINRMVSEKLEAVTNEVKRLSAAESEGAARNDDV